VISNHRYAVAKDAEFIRKTKDEELVAKSLWSKHNTKRKEEHISLNESCPRVNQRDLLGGSIILNFSCWTTNPMNPYQALDAEECLMHIHVDGNGYNY
jgi:hypothetical protein